MGLGKKGSTLKDAALLKPSTTGGGYIRDTETSNGKLLCPDWNVTFADNSVWHSRTVKWMRQNMKTQFPAAMIDEKSDDAILDQLSTVFRNIVQAYNILQSKRWAAEKCRISTSVRPMMGGQFCQLLDLNSVILRFPFLSANCTLS
jgi:hypothetical protein